jgi:branched-chain amino acid transport system substrate-binding protein
MADVSKAWADSVNASGGINGHPVSMTTMDDGGDPATALQDAKTLVQQDHIIALVGEFSLADAAFAKYMEDAGVPVVGGITPEASFLTNPDFFPSGSQLLSQTIGTIALAKTAGKTHIGVLYCAESPICAELVPLADGAAALNGLKITTAKVSSTAPSYTANCLALKSAGVDALFSAVAAPVVQRIAADCAQQGYTPLNVSQISTGDAAWLTDATLSGSLLSGYDANPFDTSLPAVAALQAALAKYEPSAGGSNLSADALGPWAGGLLFQAAAKAADVGPTSTAADVKKGLYALKNETLGGVSGPLNFTPGKPAFVPCYFTDKLTGGKIVSLNGDKPTCFTPAQSAALLKALKL